ncbi:hypothetical protein AB1A65_15275 [Muricauda sp. ANG21]|uniref:hypothetical protein n=1 Tax=Allomuricauda sp. ANG21 TaxID=3042468 RepID=UPI0034549383
MTKKEKKLLDYFWNSKRGSLDDALPAYILAYLEYGTLGSQTEITLIHNYFLKLERDGFVTLYSHGGQYAYELTDVGKKYLNNKHNSFRNKLEKFNAAFPPLLISISSVVGIIAVVVEVIQLFK